MEKTLNIGAQINKDSKTDHEKQFEKFELIYNQTKIVDFENLPKKDCLVYSPTEPDKEIFLRSTINGVTGRGKARKTSFIIGLLTDAVNKNQKLNILWIDTEQAKFDLKYLHYRIKKRTNYLENFEFHTFRSIDINSSESISYIDFILQKQKKLIKDRSRIDNIKKYYRNLVSSSKSLSGFWRWIQCFSHFRMLS